MSRLKKTFAPRAGRSETQTDDNKEDEKKYEQITDQDSKISLAKTEVTQITYLPFRNRAFNKIEKGSSRIQFSNSGLHVLALNKALNALGHKVPENEAFFGDTTKIALINFQKQNGITGSGIFDKETLLKMNEVLEASKDKASNNTVLSAKPEKPKIIDSKDSDSIPYPIVVVKNQKFNGKLIQTDEDLNRFAEYKMKITRPLTWKPKFTDEYVKDLVSKGGSVIYTISSKTNNAEKEVEALSPAKKQFIRNAASITDYIQNIRILDLLKQLSEEEIADYKSKVSAETANMAAIEASLKAYIKARDKNQKDNDELETVKTKLYGLEDLYKEYAEYKSLLSYNKPVHSGQRFSTSKIENDRIAAINARNNVAAQKLTENLHKNGFKSISEFESFIKRYETAFETETVRIGVETLQHYKHTLYKEAQKLNDNVFLDNLSQSIIKSGAKENYKRGAEIKESSKRVLEHGITYIDHEEYNLGQSKVNNADKSISTLSSQTPLVNDPSFDKEEFAKVGNKKDLKIFLQKYITSQNQKVDSVINNIKEKPEHIYELDNLFKASYAKQRIEKGTIYDRIITAKYTELSNLKILLGICTAIFAIALIAVTWGAAAPVVLAGGILSLAVSIDVAYDTINEYKNNKEFHDVGLLSDDPSLVWVVIAIAGVALDAASLAVVLKSAKPISEAAKAFNQAEDTANALAKLESDLAKIKGLEDKVQLNIVKQAKIQAQQQKILTGFVKSRQLVYATIPYLEKTGELLARAVFAIRKGFVTFDSFVAELKLAKLIEETGLTSQELLLVKSTFERAKTLAKDDKLFIELEKAIADNDLAKVKNLFEENGKLTGGKLPKDADFNPKLKNITSDEEKIAKDISKAEPTGDFSKKGTKKSRFEQTEDIAPGKLPYGEVRIMKVKTIRLMQNSISNPTGDYFVLENAYRLYKGEKIPTSNIKVWYNTAEDAEGIWTVDHRRLAAYKIAGRENIQVEYIYPKELMSKNTFKMTTETKGTDMSIIVYLDENGKFVNNKTAPKDIIIKREEWKLIEQENGSMIIKNNQGKTVPIEEIKNYLPNEK
ncbi:peptidoglycan-binding domain-containing protein [Chryseobacterium viscerum]|uniref:Peptidoglycan binding-like domain-containing protein n=1 Tax=Chryseobacterium viscerum TaxID=1037377 RepID=A0A316WVA1_9FLAO|nr:peptidoglycan-binding domain-containing protein [Chryseobacterium viscerum]PWN64203.1 hypothetical protein C1634_006300 [Chryseobacterium viscerum]